MSSIISEKWGAQAPRVSCSAPSPNTLGGDVQVMRWRKSSGFPSAGAPTGAAGAAALPNPANAAAWRGHNRAFNLIELLVVVGEMWWNGPAGRHNQGGNLSFADGHVEHWRWAAPKLFKQIGQDIGGAADLKDFRRVQAGVRPETRPWVLGIP
jgi:prepilin-type processing-associated H-X9-DG protein